MNGAMTWNKFGPKLKSCRSAGARQKRRIDVSPKKRFLISGPKPVTPPSGQLGQKTVEVRTAIDHAE